jgi:hypothetical protein
VAKELGLGVGTVHRIKLHRDEVLIHGVEMPVHCLAGRDHGRPLWRRVVVRLHQLGGNCSPSVTPEASLQQPKDQKMLGIPGNNGRGDRI